MFLYFSAKTLNPVGIKYKIKGYINPIAKLDIESVIKIIWVFSYTEQKAVTKYQKNKNKHVEKMKKTIILNYRHFITDLICFSLVCFSLTNSLIV